MVRSIQELERLFYKNPNSGFHLRGLAEIIDASPGFVSKHIRSLLERDIVDEKREGNMRVFTAKTSSGEYRRNKRAFNIREVLTSDLVPYLENKLYPDAIVLFGSYLKGTDTEDSDIDIAVIGGRDKIPPLSEYEGEFDRKIKLTLTALDEAEPEFIETLGNGLVLSGYLEVSQLARDR